MRRVLLISAMLVACGGSTANTGGAKPPDKDSDGVNDKKGESTIVPIEKRSQQAEVSFNDAETAFAAAGNDCAQLCKALGSMTNATDRLCELAKENGDDKRCDAAKSKLDTARAKVKSTCGECS